MYSPFSSWGNIKEQWDRWFLALNKETLDLDHANVVCTSTNKMEENNLEQAVPSVIPMFNFVSKIAELFSLSNGLVCGVILGYTVMWFLFSECNFLRNCMRNHRNILALKSVIPYSFQSCYKWAKSVAWCHPCGSSGISGLFFLNPVLPVSWESLKNTDLSDLSEIGLKHWIVRCMKVN